MLEEGLTLICFSVTYPSMYRELTEEEVEEFYSPKDFLVGDTVFLYARRYGSIQSHALN